MHRIKTIFFDLDGTLLPMDQQKFLDIYFHAILSEFAPYGYDPQTVKNAFFLGVAAMAKNDGKELNETVYWREFDKHLGGGAERLRSVCDDFYRGRFHEAQAATRVQPLAKEGIKIAREKGMGVVLATTPMFPRSAVETRLQWADLAPSDFDYISTYETERHAKPQSEFFTDLIKKLGLSPEECLMVGNDEQEDMYACTQAGIRGYLVTDCLIAREKYPFTGMRGTFEEFIEYLKTL